MGLVDELKQNLTRSLPFLSDCETFVPLGLQVLGAGRRVGLLTPWWCTIPPLLLPPRGEHIASLREYRANLGECSTLGERRSSLGEYRVSLGELEIIRWLYGPSDHR